MQERPNNGEPNNVELFYVEDREDKSTFPKIAQYNKGDRYKTWEQFGVITQEKVTRMRDLLVLSLAVKYILNEAYYQDKTHIGLQNFAVITDYPNTIMFGACIYTMPDQEYFTLNTLRPMGLQCQVMEINEAFLKQVEQVRVVFPEFTSLDKAIEIIARIRLQRLTNKSNGSVTSHAFKHTLQVLWSTLRCYHPNYTSKDAVEELANQWKVETSKGKHRLVFPSKISGFSV